MHTQLPESDFTEISFGDRRLNKRLLKFITESRKQVGQSILGTEQTRGNAKGFYRLLSNEKLQMSELLYTAKHAAISRMTGTVLLVQDTSDINLNGHKKTEGLGYCSEHIRGVKLHSCIALNPEGIPFGLIGQSYETRAESKSKLNRSEKANRPIEEKESFRWLEMLKESTEGIPDGINAITVCDREGDFYELYAKCLELSKDYIIRVIHDRNSVDNEKTADKIRKSRSCGTVTVNIPRNSRKGVPARQTTMEIAYCSVSVKKPLSIKEESVPQNLTMNLVRITELTPPAGQEPIEWILATSLSLRSAEEAMTIVDYYIQRWKIERFHFVLKSGCNAEKIQQRTYEKIKPLLLIYSVISLFIMAITFLGRVAPDMPCDLLFEEDEWKTLYRIANKTKIPPDRPYSMADAVMYLGQLGSYKRAPSDGAPGLKAIWKGLFVLYHFMAFVVGQV